MSKFWDQHYRSFDIAKASPFAIYCLNGLLRSTDSVVELGSGNGRDAFFIAPKVHKFTGLDSSSVAIKVLNDKLIASSRSLSVKTQFLEKDFTNQSFDEFMGNGERLVIYSRFSYHSIGYEAAANLLQNIRNLMVPHVVMMEMRTIDDELYGEGEELGPHEFMTDHYRRFVDPDAFLQELCQDFSFSYFEISKGFAPFGDLDPAVLRVIFRAKIKG